MSSVSSWMLTWLCRGHEGGYPRSRCHLTHSHRRTTSAGRLMTSPLLQVRLNSIASGLWSSGSLFSSRISPRLYSPSWPVTVILRLAARFIRSYQP